MRPGPRFLLIAISILAAVATLWLVFELDRTQPAGPRTPPADGSGTALSDGGDDPSGRAVPPPLEGPAAAGDGAESARAGRGGELSIRGRVVARGAAPIAGARIRVVMESRAGSREIAHATTGADGQYSAKSDAPYALDEQARNLATLCIAVDADGFQPETRCQGWSWDAAHAADRMRTWTADFRLEAGNTLSGRIVDAGGAPVRGASVVLIAGARGERTVQRPPQSEVKTTSDGRFEIGFVSGGRYHLWARKDRVGSARIDELELTAAEDRKLGDVALAGAGTLAGTVRYPDGSPVRDLEVWAVPESLAADANALALAASNARDLEEGDGLVTSSARTNERGEFRVEGLRQAGYALRAGELHLALEPRGHVYRAPSDSIRLVLDAYRLRVFVRSKGGAPLEGAVVACTEVEPNSDGSLETGATTHSSAVGPEALATFEVAPDQTYALTARAKGSREAEELVILAPGEHEAERTLVLEPALAAGRLRVSVTGARGEALDGLRVALLSPLSGQPIPELASLVPDENGWLPPIPPGTYGVEVGFVPRLDPPGMHFPARSQDPIVVDAGRDHDVALSARAGGRLRLALAVDGPLPAGFGPPDPRTAPNPETAYDAWLQEHGARAELSSGDGHGGVALQFVEPPLEAGGAPRLAARLAPGSSAIADRLLEPGIYTVRVEANGFRPAEAVVQVEAALVRTVELRLRAD